MLSQKKHIYKGKFLELIKKLSVQKLQGSHSLVDPVY